MLFVNEYRHTGCVVYTDFWFSVRLRCRLMSRRTSLRKVSRLTSCCWHWSNTCSMHSMYCGVHFDNSSRDFSYFSFACSTHTNAHHELYPLLNKTPKQQCELHFCNAKAMHKSTSKHVIAALTTGHIKIN